MTRLLVHPPRGRCRLALVLAVFLVPILVTGCGGSGSGDLSGTYEAKDKDGGMTLEFKSGRKVHMTLQETGGPADTKDADYLIDGNKVTIQVPGGMPLTLVHNGDVLEGNVMGQALHFTKK